jgi:hypothetical protein
MAMARVGTCRDPVSGHTIVFTAIYEGFDTAVHFTGTASGDTMSGSYEIVDGSSGTLTFVRTG